MIGCHFPAWLPFFTFTQFCWFPGWKDWIITEIRRCLNVWEREWWSLKKKTVCEWICSCKRCVCKQFQLDLIPLPPFLYLLPSHTHTYTLISSNTSSKPIHSLPELLYEASCVSSTVSHFLLTPLPTSRDKIPSRPLLPLLHSASCYLSSPPVLSSGVKFSQNQTRGNPSFLVCTSSFCLYPEASVLTACSKVSVELSCTEKITLKPDIRSWNVETVSISHWLTSDFIFFFYHIILPLFLGVSLGSIICSLCLHFSFPHSNIHTQFKFLHIYLSLFLERALRIFPELPTAFKILRKSLWVLTFLRQISSKK